MGGIPPQFIEQQRSETDASDANTDMIVMGGYGHSRLREFVLGGVTSAILESMTVPALMSH